MTHLDRIESIVGSLRGKDILDLGSGRGGFLMDCARRGYHAVGLEAAEHKIRWANDAAEKAGVSISIVRGRAESMPFPDASFDFINASELIEHVQNPSVVLAEMARVLRSSGSAYVSAQNRFGFFDPHFRVYFLNWMPRSWGEKFLAILGKHKDYHTRSGLQKISEMHYFTFSQFCTLAQSLGFQVYDIREIKIKRKYSQPIRLCLLLFYKLLFRPLYFSTFHFLLQI